jgi:hypothetical protein
MKLNFVPSKFDISWCKMMVEQIRDGGVWCHKQAGLIYQFDHTAKTLTLTASANPLTDPDTAEFHENNSIAFGKIGYKVVVSKELSGD